MNFFRVNFKLCTKISALWELRGFSFKRALFHSLLMLVLCPLLISAVLVYSEKNSLRHILNEIFEKTGGLRVSRESCALANPGAGEAHFSFRLFRVNFLFDFFPSEKSLPGSWPGKETAGVAGTPRNFFLWAGRPSPGYTLVCLPPQFLWLFLTPDAGKALAESGETFSPKMFVQPPLYSGAGLLAEIRENGFAKAAVPPSVSGSVKPSVATEKTAEKSVVIPPETLLRFILSVIGVSLFFGFFFQCLFQFLACALFFSLAQKLRFFFLPVKLSYGKILTLTLYSMFPALILDSLFKMFQLGFLSFQTVFFIVFFIYHFLAFNFVMRQLNPPPRPEEPFGGGDL